MTLNHLQGSMATVIQISHLQEEKTDLTEEVNQKRLQSQDQRTQWQVVSEQVIRDLKQLR